MMVTYTTKFWPNRPHQKLGDGRRQAIEAPGQNVPLDELDDAQQVVDPGGGRDRRGISSFGIETICWSGLSARDLPSSSNVTSAAAFKVREPSAIGSEPVATLQEPVVDSPDDGLVLAERRRRFLGRADGAGEGARPSVDG